MKVARGWALPLGAAAILSLAGCFASRTRPSLPATAAAPSTAPLPPPPVPQATPDAVPRVEPRSRYGNPPFYDVFGKRYYVLSSSVAYVERGVASWYGPGFHQVKTSNGETYDMYGMTAAHRTLPLPAYVRVTNLQNGRSVVVRVNDRGPFVANRIIDLSYSAALRLDMLRSGTAMVEVRAIDPGAPPRDATAPLLTVAPPPVTAAGVSDDEPPEVAGVAPGIGPGVATPGVATPGVTPGLAAAALAAPSPLPSHARGAVSATSTSTGKSPAPGARAPLYIQAGAFSDPANAEHLAARLRGGAYGKVFVRNDVIAGRKMYRVRIGPVPNVREFDRIVAALEQAGVHDAHLALE